MPLLRGQTMKTKTRFVGWMLVLICMVSVKALAFYDPGVQRWVNRDPLGDVGSLVYQVAGDLPWEEYSVDAEVSQSEFQEAWVEINRNLYGAISNDPLGHFDSFGLCPELPPGSPGSARPENIAALDMRGAGEIARAAAQAAEQKAKEQMTKAVQTMTKQAAKEGAKSLQKSIKSFNKRIAEHLKKIADNPNSRDVNHWKKEIENWQRLVEAAEKVLKACPKE